MMKRLTIVVLAMLVLAAMPGTALAQETNQTDRPTTNRPVTEEEREARLAAHIEQIKARALEAIKKRLATVAELEAAVERSEYVSASNAAKLQAELRKTARGLEALAEEIQAATTIEELRELVPQIFEFGVYRVIAPKVHLTLGASYGVAFATRLEEFAGKLQEVLDRMAEHGIDVEEAGAELEEMTRAIASGKEKATQVPEMVIDLEPDDPGAGEVLHQAKSLLQSAAADLRSAAQSGHEIVAFIKRVLGRD